MKKSEILPAVIEYFNGDELSANVWIDKYALKNRDKEILERTPDDMHERLANEFARIESNYPNPISKEEIFGLLKDFKYIIPQGSPMHGIGNNNTLTSLSNCFVIGNNDKSDSYGSILKTDQEQVQLMKRRGGVGHDISHYRPSGSLANNTALGDNAGATLYMERFSHSTREVAQDGRRGALMLSIDIRHPDAEKFIDAKLQTGKVTGANISIKLRDDFMSAIENNTDYIQRFPITLFDNISSETESFVNDLKSTQGGYGILYPIKDENGENIGYVKKIKAKPLWDKIITNAHKSAEPGIFFWDKILSESPADMYGNDWVTLTTNPCGEIPLCGYDSCRLLVLNLYSYVINPFTPEARFDWDLFRKHVRIAQRLMDDIVDLEIEKVNAIIAKIEADPEPLTVKGVELDLWTKIRDKSIDGRRTGLGITAEGDMLAALGFKYGSEDGIIFSELLHQQMAKYSYGSSIEMAKERGAFRVWDAKTEMNNPFIQRVVFSMSEDIINDYMQYGRRNISNLTIAPTGTTSMMSRTTSGIEPLFMPWYIRRRKTDIKELAVFVDETGDMWEEYKVFHPKFIEWFKIAKWPHLVFPDGLNPDYESPENYIQAISTELLQEIFEESPYYGATANDVDWVASVKLQGEVQKWIDHSISKTINLPEDTPVEVVDQLYLAAYHAGCKGTTVYREGSRSGVLIADKKHKEEEHSCGFKPIQAVKRPKNVNCDIFYPTINKEKYIVLIGFLNGFPYEVFAYKVGEDNQVNEHVKHGITRKRKSGWYDLYDPDGKTILVENLSAQFETPEEEDRTRLISGWLRTGGDVKFVVDVLNKSKGTLTTFSKVIARQLKQYIKAGEKSSEKCPECGDHLIFEEGCLHCNSCGYSKCG